MFCRETSPWRSELRQSKSNHCYRIDVLTVQNTSVIMTFNISFFFNFSRLVFSGSIVWSQCAVKRGLTLSFASQKRAIFDFICKDIMLCIRVYPLASQEQSVKQVTHYWKRLNVLCTVIIHQIYQAMKSCDNSLFMTNPVMRSENGKNSSIHLT